MDNQPTGTPSAAETVLAGKITEDTAAELARERELRTSLEGKLKDRELRIATLEDENGQLKRVTPTTRKGLFDAIADYFPKVD